MLTLLSKKRKKTAALQGNELSDGETLFRAFGQFKAALDHIENYGRTVEDLDEKAIQERKESFTAGYLNILRKSLFYDHVIDRIGPVERELPEIYPETEYELPSHVYKDVNLRDRCVFVNYRKPWAIAAQCSKIRRGKKVQGEKYRYYENLGIGYPQHGNHRVIAAAMNDYDLIAEEVDFIDDKILLDNLEIRGMQWYRKNSDVSLGRVSDYRIALIFMILQETQAGGRILVIYPRLKHMRKGQMGKIYNSLGVEVKKTIKGVCPTCGLGRCGGFTHCLRCGQPLLYTEPYVELYKNLDDEIAAIDALTPEDKKHLGIDIDTMSLKKRREQVLKGIGIVEYDVKALRNGKLIRKDTDKEEFL